MIPGGPGVVVALLEMARMLARAITMLRFQLGLVFYL